MKTKSTNQKKKKTEKEIWILWLFSIFDGQIKAFYKNENQFSSRRSGINNWVLPV